MDGDCSYEDFRDCLRSLEKVNRWLLGYRPTLAWLERLPRGLREPMHMSDVGCGGEIYCGRLQAGTETGHRRAVNGNRLESLCGARGSGVHAEELGITWVTGDAGSIGRRSRWICR